jgi:hypothetical protein
MLFMMHLFVFKTYLFSKATRRACCATQCSVKQMKPIWSTNQSIISYLLLLVADGNCIYLQETPLLIRTLPVPPARLIPICILALPMISHHKHKQHWQTILLARLPGVLVAPPNSPPKNETYFVN